MAPRVYKVGCPLCLLESQDFFFLDLFLFTSSEILIQYRNFHRIFIIMFFLVISTVILLLLAYFPFVFAIFESLHFL